VKLLEGAYSSSTGHLLSIYFGPSEAIIGGRNQTWLRSETMTCDFHFMGQYAK